MSSPSLLGKLVRGWFIIVGVFATLFMIGIIIVAAVFWPDGPDVPKRAILTVDLEKPVLPRAPTEPFGQLLQGPGVSVFELVTTIDRAAKDERVKALFVTGVGNELGMAVVQELREAIARFRKSGKPAHLHTDTFGEVQPGNQGYYLATAFDKIWLQPSGQLSLTGLLAEMTFFKGTLDKLDVTVQGDQRKEFKSAFESFTRTSLSEPARESTRALLDDIARQLRADVARDRKLTTDKLTALMNQAPLLAKTAHEAGLVDELGYRSEALDALKKAVQGDGGKAELIELDTYKSTLIETPSPDKLALIYGVGAVVRGGNPGPMSEEVMDAESVTAAFREAIDDEHVRAIVFRVDSPGGSYIASDTIWHETRRARDAGKPVIVSMGNVAGSGGYFVSMAADRIVAQPATLTGSIGVFMLKPNLRGLFDKIGVSFDHVQVGDNAEMFSLVQELDPAAWQLVQTWLDTVYADFVSKAAQGRKLPIEKLEAVAKGRVWTGAQAKEVGLIDELGGLDKAIALARAAAKLPEDRAVTVVELPRAKPLLERLLSGDFVASGAKAARQAVEGGGDWPAAVRPLVQRLADPAREGVLVMPSLRVGP